MRVLCIARHPVLSDHIARLFAAMDVETAVATGLRHGGEMARSVDPDVVLCEYDLLAAVSLASWEADPRLAKLPVLAVSLTRRPEEAFLLDVNGIAEAFLYLPRLTREDGLRLLAAVRRTVVAPAESPVRWPREQPRAPEGVRLRQ